MNVHYSLAPCARSEAFADKAAVPASISTACYLPFVQLEDDDRFQGASNAFGRSALSGQPPFRFR